jgi:hypothetical protein
MHESVVLPLLALLRLMPHILRRENQLIATIDHNTPSRPQQYSSRVACQITSKMKKNAVEKLLAE